MLRNGAQIGFVRQTTDTSFDFSSDYKDTGNGEYSIYVRAYKMSRGNYLAEGESSKVTLNELPDTVTIHFDSNGGTGTMDDVTVAYAANYTLPECSLTPPANMEFAIWEIPGGQITAGSSTKFFENTTVKALWKAKTYTVTFDPGEGSGTSFIRKVNAGEKLSLPSCSFTAPENKVFDKWDMGEPSDKIDVSGDMTVTALWKDAETYTVTVNNDGNGTAFASPTSGPDGTVVTLTATPNPGYKFKEWTRQAGMLSGGTSIPNATSATTTFTISGYNVVVKAIFEAESPTAKTLDSIAITTPPTKTEYTEGDSFDPTGMVVEATYSDGSSAPVTGYTISPIGALTISDTTVTVTYTEDGVTKTTTQNIKVDAASVPTDYTVTVNVNNAEYGTASASPTSGPYGTVVTLTATPNPGYKFKEWRRNAGMFAGGALEVPNATSATTTFTIGGYNVVVTAIFEAEGTIPLPEYDITVTDGKATVGAGTEISKAAEGTTVTLTANAAPTDKVFDKWVVEDGSASITLANATSATTTFTMPAGEVRVQATYKAAPHTHNLTLVTENPATCTTDGNKAYYTCDGCDKWFEDASGSVEITDKTSVIISATNHTPSDWKSDADNHWKECTVVGCGVIIEDSKAAHTASDWITDTAATATTDGTKHRECTVCYRVLETGTIPATGSGEHTHSYGSDWKSNADKHWHECSCGDKSEEAPHTFKWVVDKEATTTEKGSKHEECEVCGYKKSAVEIPATGTPTNPPKPGNPDSPQTGDNSMMGLWITLLFVSAVGVVGTTVYSRKKKEQAE